MTNVKIIGALVALVALVALASTARAQGAEAEALFREGRRLVEEGDLPAACDKFEASDRLESTVGAMLNLADCRERTGQLATAWATFGRAEAAAHRNGDRVREQEAARRAALLEPRLAYLTISVPDSSQVDGLIVERDGAAVDPALWNVSIPVDAGSHRIAARAPGSQPWHETVNLTAAQRVSVDVPGFKPVGELIVDPFPDRLDPRPARPGPGGPRSDRVRLPGPTAVDDAAPRVRHMTGLRWAAVGTGGAGLAGLAVATARALAARDLQSRADQVCPGAVCDDPAGLALNRDAERAARQANLLFAAGGALATGAAVLWVVGAPAHGTVVAPIADHDTVGLSFTGSF